MKARHWLVVLALAALILIVVLNWAEVKAAFVLLQSANFYILAFVPLVQLLSFYSNGRYYQSFLDSFNYQVPFSKLYRMSFALNFVNQVSPSLGITGVTFLSYVLRQEEVPAGKVTLIQYGRYALTYVSFTLLLLLALTSLYFGGGIDKIVVRIVVVLVAASLLLSGLLVFAFSSRNRFNALVYWIQRAIDWVGSHFRKSGPIIGKERITRLLTEFHNGFDLVLKERHRLRIPFWYAFMGNAMELATLFVVFMALGIYVNPGAVIIAYAIASGVGVISIVPGDVGVFEIAMITALTATGVSVAEGLSATLLYRVLNKALFLPVGFYFYSQLLGRGSGQPSPQR